MPEDEKFPSFEQIGARVAEFVRRNPGIARMEPLGLSEEGRPVQAVEVTDPDVAAADKQVALVICGRHGGELGTRVVGTAVLEWLASEAGARTRREQRVIVVPVANPDGCVREQFHAPKDGLSETERKTIAALAERTRPDAVVDVHSLGGNDVESVITAHTTRCAEDEFIQNALAGEMVRAAAAGGYPFDLQAVAFADGYNNFFSGLCYERFHSVAFGMEVNHRVLGPAEAGASGLAAIAGLLEAGNRRFPWQRETGYPNGVLIGNFLGAIQAGGADAESRRRSRCEIWRNRSGFAVPGRQTPEAGVVRITTEYSDGRLTVPARLCCRIRGKPNIRGVRINAERADWACLHDECSTYVFADAGPPVEGACELEVRF